VRGKVTRKREIIITKELLLKRQPYYVYKGKSYDTITFTEKMIGHKLGEFSLTKKLGPKIHDSPRNRKRREKNKHKK